MTQKEALRKIMNCISDELKLFDFVASYKDQWFVRRSGHCIYIYQLLIYNRTIIKTGQKGFLIEPYIWVHISEVEEYYKKITINTVIKKDTDFVTIGNSIANLLANPDGFFRKRNESLDLHVFNEIDISYVASQLVKQFKEIALPYILNNSSVAAVDKLANTYPDEYKVHLGNDNYRIIKGVIAARLNNNPSLDKIIEIYNKQLIDRNMHEDTREEMKRLMGILPEMSL